MYTAWIEDCVVHRVSLHDGVMLGFSGYNEVVIARPLRLTLPAVGKFPVEEVLVDPDRVTECERPLFDLAGTVCTIARCGEDGVLHLVFSDGHRIDVDADAHATAWELYGKHHGYMACLPGGRVRVVRHDLPEDADADTVLR
ncbi:DUF6188 family protein [Mycolicibacter senuensis]|uniref:DUF6188 family protein n=1 Tax=Mycolicibacter senuensis TaxID=386913 RepID=UPI000DCB6FE1|nr:DUF6188 family protein [Mycolicibacter senuensis]RAV00118.1 hypothetical protein DQP56_09905 [Mycolicibacter senuensis]